MKIAHIINPVKVPSSSDLYQAQPVTFKSMLKAKEYCAKSADIHQFAVCYEEDLDVVPNKINILPALSRSVLDVNHFKKERKLPLIGDILRPLMQIEEIDYVVYTNVDIALMPYFYEFVIQKIERGSDSIIVNRRVIDSQSNDLSILFSQVGNPHPGYDCFIFRKELIEKFELGKACIGANWIGRVLIANLINFSSKLEIIKDAHLTFHIGEDGAWLKNDFSEFDLHNKNEAYLIINQLIKSTKDEKKKSELLDIIEFMDNWGLRKSSKIHTDDKWSLKRKIKFKLKQFLS